MKRLAPSPVPDDWSDQPAWTALTRIKETGQPDLKLLSVYRDLGVIPKDSRDDNFNKASVDLTSYQVVKPGRVVANKMKTWQGSIAVSSYEGIVSPAYMVFDADPTIYGRFLHYLLRSRPYVAEYGRLSYGVRPGQWDLRWDDLRDVRLLIPGRDTQRLIADFLDRETSRIDALVEAKRKLIGFLAEKRTALITHAVTKGLDSTVPLKDSGVDWIGSVPAHWHIGPLRRWWEVLDCKHRTATYVDAGIPIVGTPDVRQGRLSLEKAKHTTEADFLDLTEGHRLPHRGDIIYSRNASLGQAAYVDSDERFCMGQDVCLIRSQNESDLFLMYALGSKVVVSQVETLVVGATFKRINVDQIRNLLVLRPPREEQVQIAKHLDRLDSTLRRLEQMIRDQLTLLAEYRQALITAAVTGQLDEATLKGHKPADEAMEFEVPV
jgi:type I restriction enzyme S subunit